MLPGKQLKIQGNYMKVSQQGNNFNLFAFIAVHTVTKNYHCGFGFGFRDIKLRRLGVSNSQNYSNEMKVFLSRGE